MWFINGMNFGVKQRPLAASKRQEHDKWIAMMN
jgi:hypothetical protein